MSYVPSGQSDFKKPVRVATTANVNLSSPGSTIDSVTLSVGDRVLVKNQTTASENGIYVFDTSSTSMTRANDANAAGELDAGTLIVVEEGSTNADTSWIVSTNGTITIGTTSIAFAQLAGGGSSSASGVSYAGSTNLSANDVEAALDELDAEKAAVSHSHAISDVTGLQSALDEKLASTLLPSGLINPYAGTSAPSGWLLCDGSAVSRSVYAALFAVIGTTFGAGDGSTTFNLPDMRGRTPVGLDNLGGSDAGRLDTANTLGGSGGSQKHTLSSTELPPHNHGGTLTTNGSTASFATDFEISGGSHSHSFTYGSVANTTIGQTAGRVTSISTSSNANTVATQTASHTHTVPSASLNTAQQNHSHTITINSAYGNGSNAADAHNNMQPYLLVGYIIKT